MDHPRTGVDHLGDHTSEGGRQADRQTDIDVSLRAVTYTLFIGGREKKGKTTLNQQQTYSLYIV